MGIAMFGASVDQRENIEKCYIMAQRIQQTAYIIENKRHHLTLNLDGIMQQGLVKAWP